jgi:Rap1a immunity proteins
MEQETSAKGKGERCHDKKFNVFAAGVMEKDFEVQTTQSLVNLCTASPQDPLYNQAINFCHGYLVGAYHYYEAQASGPKGTRLVSPPEPRPSRNATISMFIEWAKEHPRFMSELPVQTEFRFLTEKWPFKP